ncbi:MAG TPA: nitrilase-related carbon-nitrogen hydrolase [Anaerolineales bacterium]|nr:nitrilase-related carbon-nitrogen hydrolase [Anaerolineales bacterium]
MLRISLVQMRCEKGDIRKNLETITYYLDKAKQRNCDFVAFPEMSLTGYADPTRFPHAIVNLDGPEVQMLVNQSQEYRAAILAGIIEANPLGKPFITQVVIHQGKMIGFYRKISILDEETEWFSPGKDVFTFHHKGLSCGIAICADISNEKVWESCKQSGADFVFELAAPGLYGEQATRNWQKGYQWWEGECQEYLSKYSKKYGLWIGVATQAGRTIDEDFPGGGYLFSPSGDRELATQDHLPGALYIELDTVTQQVRKLWQSI